MKSCRDENLRAISDCEKCLLIREYKYIMRSIVATLAPILSIIQLIPQLYKTYTTKSVGDLSIYFIVLILITNLLWLFHGYFINDLSLILAGLLAASASLSMLILFVMYRHKPFHFTDRTKNNPKESN